MNPADELTINGEAVYPDKDGNFDKNILLQSGFNNIIFQTKKLYFVFCKFSAKMKFKKI